jgi:epoxyqueuosine reductase
LLERWIAEERHGFMEYLARDPRRRIEPRLSFSRARSVVVVAWPYPAPQAPAADWRKHLTGRIAAYARGPDYHDSLGERLEALGAFISERFGGGWRSHVDAGPLVEKELAVRAGLGWYGRNTNLLTRNHGSFLLLACLLTEAWLAEEAPLGSEHCGTCTACRPACPTGALDTGATIDANRCIAYLTIEHRGPIPVALRSLVGNWVFGCDTCQQVCPWNPDSSAADSFLSPSLVELLELTNETFLDRYGHSAVKRAKRRGLARNAAIALGNSMNRDAVDPLGRALREHDEPLVRAHAAWALGELGGPSARVALARATRGAVPPVAAEIAAACRAAGG